jgi:hypothetical protein
MCQIIMCSTYLISCAFSCVMSECQGVHTKRLEHDGVESSSNIQSDLYLYKTYYLKAAASLLLYARSGAVEMGKFVGFNLVTHMDFSVAVCIQKEPHFGIASKELQQKERRSTHK